jgi:hypothetical protein
MNQTSLGLNNESSGSVAFLNKQFNTEEERRTHFLDLLAKKLKDPEFRKIKGFPIGNDEDILTWSDPPYYTACPNPWLAEFVEAYGTPYDPKKPYHREPFAADVTEGKNHPIYNAHSYHTKVPHRAIMRYILHYTEPGDLIYDGFAGSGMAGVAARLCGDKAEVQDLGYRVREDGVILDQDGKPFSKLGIRRIILNELAPAATFIAHNYSSPIDVDGFALEARRILKEVEKECGWMYETTHTDGKSKGRVNYIVWSDMFTCPECGGSINFWDATVNTETDEVVDEFHCPQCSALLTKRKLNLFEESKVDSVTKNLVKTARQEPVLINYSVDKRRYEKAPDAYDLDVIKRAEMLVDKGQFPTNELPDGYNLRQPKESHSLLRVHQFYSSRTLAALQAYRRRTKNEYNAPLEFLFGSVLPKLTKMNRYMRQHGSRALVGPMANTLYIPAIAVENNVLDQFEFQLKKVVQAFGRQRVSMISTASSEKIPIPDKSLDYIFVDPPFGGNIMYSEMSFLRESWLKVWTNNTSEAIENPNQSKGIEEYKDLMSACFKEAYRVLKPGRWATIEFSNTKASVWNALQTTLQECGFIVAGVAALDKLRGGFHAMTSPTAVKQDLVISAYKPNGGLEDRFAKTGETEEGAWDFTRTHLRNLPVVKASGGQLEFIAERDPRILYDRMVAFYVGHSTPVPLSSAEFQAGLAERFPHRDEMFFLPEQVNEYDKKRQQMEGVGQLSIFVEDEKSAVAWLRSFLTARPSVYQDIQPEFMQQLGASWKKWETRPELRALLDQNFLNYEGEGEVPSQIHSYLSTQFKELRNLAKDHQQLRSKAKDRWFVPDPKKNIDVEKFRTKKLLEEFWSYLPAGYSPPALNPNRGESLPGMSVPVPKIPKGKKLKELRSEAVRVGFKHCYQQKDYQTILVVAEMLPESVLNEDETLQMLYDTAMTRTGGE